MTHPAELKQLLEDLRAEDPPSDIIAPDGTFMVIVLEPPDKRVELDAESARLVLASSDTVERLFEALDYPEDCFIELHGFTVDASVMSYLERYCSTVDEL
jgi:hypothetical protein